jgi:hypothetical protein
MRIFSATLAIGCCKSLRFIFLLLLHLIRAQTNPSRKSSHEKLAPSKDFFHLYLNLAAADPIFLL